MEEEQSQLERFMKRAGLGAVGGGLLPKMAGIKKKVDPRKALLGGMFGGGSLLIGDAIYDDPSDHTYGEEAKRGATGGALGALAISPLVASTHPTGKGLIKKFLRGGMNREKALNLLKTGASIAGAGATVGGVEQPFLFGEDF